jgi:hypothetical protein
MIYTKGTYRKFVLRSVIVGVAAIGLTIFQDISSYVPDCTALYHGEQTFMATKPRRLNALHGPGKVIPCWGNLEEQTLLYIYIPSELVIR